MSSPALTFLPALVFLIVWLIPIGAVVWAAISLSAIRRSQEAIESRLGEIADALKNRQA